MKNLKLFTVATAFFFMLFSGCNDDNESPVSPELTNPVLAEVDSTACVDPPLRKWLLDQYRSGFGTIELTLIAINPELSMDQLALNHSVYFENSAANQSFGLKGEYTNQLNNSFKDLKRFWGIQSDNIIMVAAHGSVLQDRNKVFKTYKAIGYPDEKANDYADSIATLLKTYPQYLNGDHPAFSINQYAVPDTTLAGVGQIPAKIVIGDGNLQGFEGIGYRDIAPQAILAHEVGHHIQYDLGILKPGMKLIPKTARRIELMANAYAAYYLSHARGGAALQGKSVQQVSDLLSNTGDCSFKAASHHGTPSQNKAAAEWGYNLAKDAQKQGGILSGLEFARLFDAELPNIVKK